MRERGLSEVQLNWGMSGVFEYLGITFKLSEPPRVQFTPPSV